MKPKLTLEHLTPYFPHGLILQVRSTDGIDYEPLTALQRKDGHDIAAVSKSDYYLNDDENDFSIMPVLKPLKYFVDINAEVFRDMNYDLMDMLEITELANRFKGLNSITSGTMEIMAQEHIDFNNLVLAGIAVDSSEVNTVKP